MREKSASKVKYPILAVLASLFIILSSGPSCAVTIYGDNVEFRLDNCSITWTSTFEPYYVEITNDTAIFADDGGEFSITVWSGSEIDIDITTWEPYTDTLLQATMTGSDDDAIFWFGGVQPGSNWLLSINGASQVLTANATGYLSWDIIGIDSEDVKLSYYNSPPAFTNSPDLVLLDFTEYVYNVGVWPYNAKVTVVTKPDWLTWEYNILQLHGTPFGAGSYPVSLKATNQYGSTYLNWTITVYADGPAFSSNPSLVINKFDDYFYQVSVTPDYLTVVCLEKPSWLTFNSHKLQLYGQAIRAGAFDVKLTAYNPDGQVYQNFTITVNDVDPYDGWSTHDPEIGMDMVTIYILIAAGIAFIIIVATFMRRR